MTATLQKYTMPVEVNSTSILKRQLVKEITCLELQIERVRQREALSNDQVLETFEAMIGNRRRMLHNLPYEI